MFDDLGGIFDIDEDALNYLTTPFGPYFHDDELAAGDTGPSGDHDYPAKPPSTSFDTNAKENTNDFWPNDILFDDRETANLLSSLGFEFPHSPSDSLLQSSDNQTVAKNVDASEHHRDDAVEPLSSTVPDGNSLERGSAEKPPRIFISKPKKLCTPRYLPTGEGPYECNTCRKKFYWKSNLLKHYYKAQTYAARKKELAQGARVQPTDIQMLQSMLSKKRGQALECDKCDQVFFHKTHFNYHYRVHTGEKPYKCDLCEVRFARSDCLKNHRRIHTGEKPYHCNICGLRFSRSGYLRKHTRKSHPS